LHHPSSTEESLSSSLVKTGNISEQAHINEDLAAVATRKNQTKEIITEIPAHDHSVSANIDKPAATVSAAPQLAESSQVKEFPDFKKSGLVMVETPPEKVEMVVEEIIIPKRPRRKIKDVITPETGPLMQVETHK
jgi:ribonuclease E